MTCPTCGKEIPAGLFACPPCLQNAAVKAIEEYQLPFLKLFDGGTLQIAAFKDGGSTHIKMFGPHARTMCGLIYESTPRKMFFLAATDNRLKTFCDACQKQLEVLRNRARVE